MARRDNGNETPVYRQAFFGDVSKQLDLQVPEIPVDNTGLVEHDFFGLYNWCPNGLTLQMVSGLITKALTLHFSSPDFITRPELKSYVWAPSNPGIRITPASRFDTKMANQLPAIIIKRGPAQSSRIAIGDVFHNDVEGTGVTKYTRMVTGSHAIMCMAETDGGTEMLGMEVFDTLTWLGPIFRTKLPFHDFQVQGIGDLSVLDALGNKVGTQLSVSYTFEYSWTTTETGELINSLKVIATT